MLSSCIERSAMEDDLLLDDLADDVIFPDSSQESLSCATGRFNLSSQDTSDGFELLDMSDDIDDAELLAEDKIRPLAFEPSQSLTTPTSHGPSPAHRQKSLCRKIYAAYNSPQRFATVREKIELIFDHLKSTMNDPASELEFPLKARKRVHRKSISSNQSERLRILRFPGKTAMEAWRFSVVIRILEITYEAQRAGSSISKRDIYYRDPALFGNQTHVDRYVDDIAHTFGVPRSSLNISAVAKGLIAGAVTLYRRDGSMIETSQDREGTLIPPINDLMSISLENVRWILVIEKEATFRTITSSRLWPLISRHAAVITGKGYPDMASRALLHCMMTPSSRNNFVAPPVYGLSDFDPDGLAIMSTYKYGSEALSHEYGLLCPTLQWVELRSNSISKLCADRSNVHSMQGLLTLTGRDRNKAKKMLQWDTLSDSNQTDDWRRELQIMLMLNIKAELQLLEVIPGGTARLLEDFLTGQK